MMTKIALMLVLLAPMGTAAAADKETAPAAAAISRGRVSAGIMGGTPTGGTLKYWLNDRHAVNVGLGYSDDLSLHADYLWHAWDMPMKPQSGRLGAYFGTGPRFEFKRETELRLRGMVGLSYLMPRHPLELFVEVGPTLRLTPDGDAGADAGLGLRFFLD